MSKVSIVKCENYKESKEKIKKSLDLLGGVSKFVKKSQKILLKPNISQHFPPERPANTHPEFVKAVIELVKKVGGVPIIGECSAGVADGRTREVFEKSGMEKIAKETDTKFINFQEGPFIAKDIPNYKILEKTDFAKPLFDADVIINLPKLKTHKITFLTGAVKNCFGCIHPEERAYLHVKSLTRKTFSNGLLDVYSYIKPHLNIMDAIVSMEGNGPIHGNPKSTGLILASKDGIALDSIAAKIMNHEPSAIPTCKLGEERGIGKSELKKIKVLGEGTKDVVYKDFIRHPKFPDIKTVDKFTSGYIYDYIYEFITFLKVRNLDERKNLNKNKFYLISFDLDQKNLNIETGKRIIEYLEYLKNNDIKFRISRPLFPCLFGVKWKENKTHYKIHTNCKECLELFSVEKNGRIKGCSVLNNELGPNLKYMKDRNQIWKYFYDIRKKIEVNDSCKKCVYFIRGQCQGFYK